MPVFLFNRNTTQPVWNLPIVPETTAFLRGFAQLVSSCLTTSRVQRYSALSLVLFHAVYLVNVLAGDFPFDALGRPIAVDFSAKLTAGRMALEGKFSGLYDLRSQWATQQDLLGHRDPEFLNLFMSPAATALIYAPLANLPYAVAALIWTAISLCCFAAAIRWLWPLLPQPHKLGKRRVTGIALSAPPVIECLQTGQDSLLSLLLLAVAVRCLVEGKDVAAGVVLGLGIFKPQLFILFPIALLAQRRWRALAAYLTTASGLTAVSVALVGVGGIRQHIQLLSSDVYVIGIAQSQAWHMQSLPALARPLAPVEWHTSINMTFLLAGAIAVWRIARRLLYVHDRGRAKELRLYAAVIVVTGLSIPHFFSYDCSILLIPCLILAALHHLDVPIRVAAAGLYLLLAMAGPLHIVTTALPAAFGFLDTQWALIPALALLRLAIPRQGYARSPASRSEPSSRRQRRIGDLEGASTSAD